MKKTALIILDGWGIGKGDRTDAIAQAKTLNYDSLIKNYPNSTLKTYGEFVGLPDGQMGNSEVGHLNIGAGRIVYQDLVKINKQIESGGLVENPVFLHAIDQAIQKNLSLHFMGLVSHGGVHSSQHHLHAMIDIAERRGAKNIYVHAFTDGRDTDPKSAVENIQELQDFIKEKNTRLVSMIGRYYAMDRDKRWERIKVAYDLLVEGKGEPTDSFSDKCRDYYNRGITDEFFLGAVCSDGEGRINQGDVVICFNFRTDRCRQITTVLTQKNMPESGMRVIPLHFVTMTRYDEKFVGINVVYEKDNLINTLGEVVSFNGGKQLRIAETEKYPHVTFFFSGGREALFEGEERIMVSSPKVATYDLQPEMSADEVAQLACDFIRRERPDFVCLNFANADMVGHTGVFEAIVKAVETTDRCMGRVVETASKHGYQLIIIADHGNADNAINEDGTPNTSHSVNPVPCILVSDQFSSIKSGILADIAPTLLRLMEIIPPSEMTGKSLI